MKHGYRSLKLRLALDVGRTEKITEVLRLGPTTVKQNKQQQQTETGASLRTAARYFRFSQAFEGLGAFDHECKKKKIALDLFCSEMLLTHAFVAHLLCLCWWLART